MANSRRCNADLIIAADGINSLIRGSFGLLKLRRRFVDASMVQSGW